MAVVGVAQTYTVFLRKRHVEIRIFHLLIKVAFGFTFEPRIYRRCSLYLPFDRSPREFRLLHPKPNLVKTFNAVQCLLLLLCGASCKSSFFTGRNSLRFIFPFLKRPENSTKRRPVLSDYESFLQPRWRSKTQKKTLFWKRGFVFREWSQQSVTIRH